MSEYTPDTEEVKIHYAYPYRDHLKDVKRAEFDRWLAAHDREVAAKAWDEGYGDDESCTSPRENPYKNGGTL